MAFARTQAPADGQIVRCAGHGAVVVFVDEEGQPTSAPQLCPDCTQALGDGHWQFLEFAAQDLNASPIKHRFSQSQHPRIVADAGIARAPPLDVI